MPALEMPSVAILRFNCLSAFSMLTPLETLIFSAKIDSPSGAFYRGNGPTRRAKLRIRSVLGTLESSKSSALRQAKTSCRVRDNLGQPA